MPAQLLSTCEPPRGVHLSRGVPEAWNLDSALGNPYHKWFLRVLAAAPEQPPALLSCIEELARAPERESVERFGQLIREFRGWELAPNTWSALFLQDSELTWLHGNVPIDDM